jgi:CCS family citrate carrier protein
MQDVRAETAAADDAKGPRLWWRLMDFKIGIVPLPVFVGLIGVIAAFLATGKVPSDILMSTAILSVGGFACAEIGKRLPLLNQFGAAAILATFVPSYLVFAHLLPQPIVASVTEFTKASNFLYLFISAIIVGSILGMGRHVLIAGFLKIFVPLAIGSVAAAAVGVAVGSAMGLGAQHTLFYIVAPVMAGGVGEGAIPLSIGYSLILHKPQGDVFAQVLPPVMLGSLCAILLAGTLNFLGKLIPALTGEGRLQPEGHDDLKQHHGQITTVISDIAAAGVTATMLYLVGVLTQRLWDFPAPVVMLFLAVVLKLLRAAPPRLEDGAHTLYAFFSTSVTYPLLFAIGVAMTPWDKLVASFNLPVVVTIAATVTTMVFVGFLSAFVVRMYPIDTAIVASCRCGQGGTGDVAILTASNRMALMPFAQIATRIGGALTVTLSLLALAQFS